MRRMGIFLILCMILTTTVFAAGNVTQMQSNTTVHSSGKCDVTLTVQLNLDEVPAQLVFPLPAQAKNISLNGGVARTSLSGNVRNVDLKGYVHFAGSQTFVIRYELPDAITAQKNGQLQLSLELLSGFAYPIEHMSFDIALPGPPERKPVFVSTYYQEAVDSLMDYCVDGSTIRCSFNQGLKDHESLTMTLNVSETLFPQPLIKQWHLNGDDVAMYLCAAAALIYWLLFLRTLPPRRLRRTQEPVGLTAGELGCCLTAQGVDFTAMVISWAQMGYLLIQLEDNGRVLLHKRMEMGNERKDYEVRCFHALFGRRKTVDGTGHHFARLANKAGKTIPNARDYYLSSSGNPNIFRVFSVGIGISGGISMALALVNDTAWQVILGLLLSVLGAVLSWQIHTAVGVWHLRKKMPLLISLAASCLWLLVSALSGEWGVAAFVLGCQWLAGFACAYGGRRSETGRLGMSEILGLRRYLKTVPKEELQRILRSNPEYYYRMAPYALALGVDKAFARQMGSLKLSECTYLTTGMDGHLTAREWNRLLQEVVKALDAQQQYMALKQWLRR